MMCAGLLPFCMCQAGQANIGPWTRPGTWCVSACKTLSGGSTVVAQAFLLLDTCARVTFGLADSTRDHRARPRLVREASQTLLDRSSTPACIPSHLRDRRAQHTQRNPTSLTGDSGSAPG